MPWMTHTHLNLRNIPLIFQMQAVIRLYFEKNWLEPPKLVPPCSAGVTWFVMNEGLYMQSDQKVPW